MPWRARFLAPNFALPADADRSQLMTGRATTPGADARVALFISPQAAEQQADTNAYFAAYGPPVLVACADWLCERLGERSLDAARWITTQDVERGLALAAEDRFAALAVVDALADALESSAKSPP